MKIALFATLNRPHSVEIVRRIVAWLLAHDHEVRMDPHVAEATGCAACAVPPDQIVDGSDLALSIGGDGTMLGAVRQAAPAKVPVLGVNAGALGFLTELTPDDLPAAMARVVNEDYTLEARTMLHARVFRGTDVAAEFLALNDVVVRQGASARLIYLSPFVAGHQLGRMGGDGLILSTPTGSTAYGLAAGGPIVSPTTQVLVLIPICPHSLSFRPMIIPASDPVEIVCEGNQHNDDMLLTADGQDAFAILTGDRVIVQPAPVHAMLVKLGYSSFYERLREKLQWGGG